MINEKEWRQWFSASLKKIMESRGVSQRELSDGIGVTEAAVSRYVNGNRSPDANMSRGLWRDSENKVTPVTPKFLLV